MNLNLHKSDTRGLAELNWLHSRHTFSFAHYYDKNRMGFGKLRVLNDDVVEPSMGFGTHPHQNMEIVSIPLSGSLRHLDSMGNKHIIKAGEIQLMSAGTGVTHSEYNDSDTENVNFLQIWVLPKVLNVAPGYQQKLFTSESRRNQFQLVVSPTGEQGSLTINQDVYFSLINLDQNKQIQYPLYEQRNGVYAFVISGHIEIENVLLTARDGVEISLTECIDIQAHEASEILFIEVPM